MEKIKHLLILFVCLLTGTAYAQKTIPISARDLAPNFGIRPIFLDDTIHVARYLDSLDGTNSAMTDTCVTLNAKLMTMANVMLYDYRHNNDTVWIDATYYIEDYQAYTQRINTLSKYMLSRAHQYIDHEHILQDNLQQNALNLCKDTISRQHRTILNSCEGIGVGNKNRKKELKDIYYAYLSVYNRYDFSMKRNDSAYLDNLQEFANFQKNLIDNLLGNSGYTVKINNFVNTLKVRCENEHPDVLRSYQRTFRQPTPEISFASIKGYYKYIDRLETIMEVQNSYIEAVDLREQIEATGKRIYSLYSSKSYEIAKTYQQVAATVNTVPSFNTLADAEAFIQRLQEFTQVQACYIQDFNRLSSIQAHGDSIVKNCGIKYNEVAKAYKQISSINSMSPNYMSLDDAARFGLEMDRFELLQLQYDSIIILRQQIDQYSDTIGAGWLKHRIIHSGFQNICKQFVFTPTFIDVAGGSEFIDQLIDCREVETACISSMRLAEQSKQLDKKIKTALKPYSNIKKAYNTLENTYISIQSINHISDLAIYIQQLEAFISVQEAVQEKLETDADNTNKQLKGVKEINQMEIILGL